MIKQQNQYSSDQLLDPGAFRQGGYIDLYNYFGSKLCSKEGKSGAIFRVWAPNAQSVHVAGDFNKWNVKECELRDINGQSGIFEVFVPDAKKGQYYKYYIVPKGKKKALEKTDPFAIYQEEPPKCASILWDLDYKWQDKKWMDNRKSLDFNSKPISIYELHLGSWKRDKNQDHVKYNDCASDLASYVKGLGFTHVELLPIMEHPFYGSWGYQTLGYFAPTSRYGNPQDFMILVDALHQEGIGVILDWVPSHFPDDSHGLSFFDGTNLFENIGRHPDWDSSIFKCGQMEVNQFLLSSAMFWLDKFHIDGLRVDAVASMLYLDYSRQKGEWSPNFFGGVENLDSIAFLRELNEVVQEKHPGCLMIAEESTAWPNVTRSSVDGGLSFDMKWNMGWMNDTLKFFGTEFLNRPSAQDDLTFCMYYMYNEKYILSLSHDEVVHLKNSLIGKMPGKKDQKFSNLRSLYSYMYGFPGKKLLFMGAEFAQECEWNHDDQLQWELLKKKEHRGISQLIKELNQIYKSEKAFYELEFDPAGFEWVCWGEEKNGVLAFIRKSRDLKEQILVILNYLPKIKKKLKLQFAKKNSWRLIFNSEESQYGAKGVEAAGVIEPEKTKNENFKYDANVSVPSLSVLYYKLNM